ncbi:MAG: maleylpyruvate isomerase family mycothiol-dependent enzyme [Actinomycetota bacterium]
MIDAQTYLEHIRHEGVRIADVAAGNLEKDVPSCPGITVADLLVHTMATCAFWTGALEQNRFPQGDMPSFGNDPLEAHRRSFDAFVEAAANRDPDDTTWTWAGEGKVRFWYRRAAQELAVHRWDFENAVGETLPIDPTLAVDGVDEFLFVFGPSTGNPDFPGASTKFGGDGQTIRLEPTDMPEPITFTAQTDRFERTDAEPDVTARGTASDLLLFLWGRVPPSALEISGDASLLERWQELVKI